MTGRNPDRAATSPGEMKTLALGLTLMLIAATTFPAASRTGTPMAEVPGITPLSACT